MINMHVCVILRWELYTIIQKFGVSKIFFLCDFFSARTHLIDQNYSKDNYNVTKYFDFK